MNVMKYTISAAFVIECEPEQLETAHEDPLHKAIVEHVQSTAAILRARFEDRSFSVTLSDMIVASPEVEICPRRT